MKAQPFLKKLFSESILLCSFLDFLLYEFSWELKTIQHFNNYTRVLNRHEPLLHHHHKQHIFRAQRSRYHPKL